MMASKGAQDVSLLLLSSPSANPSRELLKDAFKEIITSAVAAVSPSSQLQIVVAGPFVPIHWSTLQSLLASLYSLSTLIQATSSKDDINVTFVLVDHVPGRAYQTQGISGDNGTTIPDLGTFASKPYKWATILQPTTESHSELVNTYLTLIKQFHSSTPTNITTIASEHVPKHETFEAASGTNKETEADAKLYGNVILAGTFDQFHAGHKLLLNASTLLLRIPSATDAEYPRAILTIGVTGDELLKNKKFAEEIEPWDGRATSVIKFISTVLCSPYLPDDSNEQRRDEEMRVVMCENKLLVRCVKIVDIYGPTIKEQAIEAIVVSAETRKGGGAVNEKRAQQGWHELALYEISVLDANGEDGRDMGEDFSSKISSTELRRRKAESKNER